MNNKNSIKSAKVAEKAAARQVAATPRESESATPRESESATPRESESATPRESESATPRESKWAKPRKAGPKAAKQRNTAPKSQDKSSARSSAKPPLLAGGNPQIAKGDGDGPVQAYIAAMPGWKRDVGRRLDALIVRTAPGVRKAVKWNSPFYGVEDPGVEGGWFLSFHCFTKYIKVAFFRGAALRPVPPGQSKQKDVRYLDIHENDQLDEAQLAAWVKQASRLPGERM